MPSVPVTMRFSDGSKISSWVSYTLRDTYTDPLASLSMTVKALRPQLAEYRAKLDKGERVRVFVGDVDQGVFEIQGRKIEVGRDGVSISIDAKTPLATPYEGGVDPDLAISQTTDAPIVEMVLRALGDYGFDRIVADAAGSVNTLSGKAIGGRTKSILVDAIKAQDAKSQVGESAYAFAARLYSRFGVCLRSAPDGTLLLGAPDYEQEAAYAVGQTFGAPLASVVDRFLEGVTIESTNENQFSECIVRGERSDKKGASGTGRPISRVTYSGAFEQRPESAPYDKVIANILPDARHTYRSASAPYKPLFIDDRHARDNDRCASVAKLALGLRGKKGYVVSGAVQGHVSKTGRVWTVDTIATVIVEADDLNEDMWILSRTLTGGANGQTTQLQMIPKNALMLGDVPK